MTYEDKVVKAAFDVFDNVLSVVGALKEYDVDLLDLDSELEYMEHFYGEE